MRRLATVLRATGGVAQDWAPFLIAAAFLACIAVVLARYSTGQNSDGLIQTLFSIQRLTVFFWGQDRFANLLPAVTAWITDPTVNAKCQLVLRIGLGVLAPLFFCAMAMPRHGAGPAWRATLLATALMLAFVPQRIVFETYVEASPYGTSFALAGFGLLALRRGARFRAVGLVLLFAAYMVNASLVLLAVPIVVGEILLFGSALAMEFAFASLIAGGATLILSRLLIEASSATSLGFGRSLAGLATYGGQMLGRPGRFLWSMFLLSGVVVAALRRRGSLRDLAGHAGVLAVAFAIGFLAVAMSSWVILNQAPPRYLVPLYVLAASLAGMCVWRWLEETVGKLARDGGFAALCVALLLVATTRDRPPKNERDGGIVAYGLRANARAVAAAVQDRSLDGIVGDYFDVWPAVFLAEQAMHDLGRPSGSVFGITYRGEVRREAFAVRLTKQGRLNFACIAPDPQYCNAMLVLTMGLPGTVPHFPEDRAPLPDGRVLTFFSIERAAPAG